METDDSSEASAVPVPRRRRRVAVPHADKPPAENPQRPQRQVEKHCEKNSEQNSERAESNPHSEKHCSEKHSERPQPKKTPKYFLHDTREKRRTKPRKDDDVWLHDKFDESHKLDPLAAEFTPAPKSYAAMRASLQ